MLRHTYIEYSIGTVASAIVPFSLLKPKIVPIRYFAKTENMLQYFLGDPYLIESKKIVKEKE